MGILCLFLQGLSGVPITQVLGFLSHTDSIHSNVKPVSSGSQGLFFFFFLPRAVATYETLSHHLPSPWAGGCFLCHLFLRVKPFNRPDFTGKVRCQAQLPHGQTAPLSPQTPRLKPQAFRDSGGPVTHPIPLSCQSWSPTWVFPLYFAR